MGADWRPPRCPHCNLWELCHRLDVELKFDRKYHNKLVRQGDRLIIDATIEKGHRDKTWESINGFLKYLNLMYLSDLVRCDGRTLSDDLLEASGWMATKVTFPKEKPTRNDKSLWRQFLNPLTDGCRPLQILSGLLLQDFVSPKDMSNQTRIP